MLEQHLVIPLVKLAVAASLASILVRVALLRRALLREERTLWQRIQLALGFSAIFGAGVATRILTNVYTAVDLGLEGSLLAGILGGYVAGLLSGVLISLPAFIGGDEYCSRALFAGVGVMGGLLRDMAPDFEEIWRFSPFLDRVVKSKHPARIRLFHSVFLGAIIFAEGLRWSGMQLWPGAVFALYDPGETRAGVLIAITITTVFAVTLPLKIWNNTRNEEKLETQQRLLNEARLAALTRQINPHFLFNTLNSISSLIRTRPDEARAVVYKLSNILRRLLRKADNLSPLREELQFIDDYMGIELVRFGDKLRFTKEIEPSTLDCLVPGMLLQPLVENSIKHGLSSKVDGGTIRVRSRIERGRLHLLVEDDGVGIPEPKLATLFEQGIGISNVNERLKVLFGNEYRMSIDSRAGVGTQTEIEIPELRTWAAAAS
ncbi:MAG TPA: sensor histidine kinase [Bryobacteraceae bacterium]|nr:sensor histidine kinase [Bryobacteraceae bacterium]